MEVASTGCFPRGKTTHPPPPPASQGGGGAGGGGGVVRGSVTDVKMRDHRGQELVCKSDVGRSSPRGPNRRSGKDTVVASDRRLFPRQNRGSRFACFNLVVFPILVRMCRI